MTPGCASVLLAQLEWLHLWPERLVAEAATVSLPQKGLATVKRCSEKIAIAKLLKFDKFRLFYE